MIELQLYLLTTKTYNIEINFKRNSLNLTTDFFDKPDVI